jgi:hypothetical protein
MFEGLSYCLKMNIIASRCLIRPTFQYFIKNIINVRVFKAINKQQTIASAYGWLINLLRRMFFYV